MKRVRIYNVLGMICNLAIIALFTVSCLAIMKLDDPSLTVSKFARYDVLASMIAVVAALFMFIANIVSIKRGKTSVPKLFSFLLFFAASFSAIALIMNICFPNYNGLTIQELFSPHGGVLFFAFIIPIVVIFEFLFISIDKKIKFPAVFFPFSGTLIYVLGVVVAVAVTKSDLVPYPFFHILPELAQKYGEDLSKNIIMLVIFIVSSFALCVVMWMINRISHIVIFGVSLADIEKKEDKKLKENVPATKRAKVANYFKNAVKFKYDEENNDVVYHISYHNRKLKTWKVKTEEAGRALKVFKTQKEAIEYAKFMVAKKGGSIRIHSMIGRIRKDW